MASHKDERIDRAYHAIKASYLSLCAVACTKAAIDELEIAG